MSLDPWEFMIVLLFSVSVFAYLMVIYVAAQ